ncbi:MAG: preprotein translocase subunit SecY [Candidatus Nanohaloarchaea archaeon]
MVSWFQAAQYLPTVENPDKEQTLKQMLIWTGITLLLYFLLSEIPIYAADAQQVETAIQQLRTFQTLLGSNIGSLITLGIGPIVTASIVLQMMVGSELLGWNTDSQEGKQKFQAAQKMLAYGLTVVQALGFTMSGTFGSVAGDPMLLFLITGQITAGGWLVILMDDLVQKWGFGSGVGLFIAGGVSKGIMTQLFSPFAAGNAETGTGSGFFWETSAAPQGQVFEFLMTQSVESGLVIFSTIAVFAGVVYLQGMKVEIPLTFGNVRGFGQKWPLKFFYTSVMPVIFVSALIANMQIIGTIAADDVTNCSPLGCFDSQGQPTDGLVYLVNPPADFVENLLVGGVTGDLAVTGFDVLHVLFYILIYTAGAAIFSIFWAKTTGQDSDAVADQIQDTGMKVPGFRKDKRVIKKVLDRYIPPLVIVAGASVGFIAATADIFRAAGGGMGILLTVMILYRLYEQLAQKHMEELHPAMKDFFQ